MYVSVLVGRDLFGDLLHVVSVTETWLTESCSSSFVDIPGFQFYRGDVVGEVRKHGAGLYVSDMLVHVKVEVSLPNIVIVHLINVEIYVISIYRPPSYSFEENNSLILFLRYFSLGKELIVLGDFNLPTLSWPLESVPNSYVSPNDRNFFDCFIESGLVQWVEFGTFFPSGNILDLILTSDEDRIGEVFSCPPLPGCHHSPVVCSVIFQFRTNVETVGSQEKLSWARADFDRISEDISEVDWEVAFDDLDVNECYDMFLSIVQNSILRNVPYREVPRTGKWISNPPRNIILQRKILWDTFKAFRTRYGRNHPETIVVREEYFQMNNIYRNYARFKQSQFEQKLIDLLPQAPKVFHSYLRERKDVLTLDLLGLQMVHWRTILRL